MDRQRVVGVRHSKRVAIDVDALHIFDVCLWRALLTFLTAESLVTIILGDQGAPLEDARGKEALKGDGCGFGMVVGCGRAEAQGVCSLVIVVGEADR